MFETTFNEAPIGMAHVDTDGSWLRVNHKLCDILGYTPEELKGMRFQDLTHPDDVEKDMENVERLLAAQKGEYSMRKRYIRSDGAIIHADLKVRLLNDPKSGLLYFISAVQDVSATQRRLDRMRHLAMHDPLTRTLNRTGFSDRIRSVYRDYLRHGEGFALAYLDLDEFKSVNDRFGHEAGDTLLREVANRLSKTIRPEDFVARMGGDEFAVALPGITRPEMLTPHMVALWQAFATPMDIGGQRLTIAASIGVAHCPTDAGSIKSLLRVADREMYRDKMQPVATLRSVCSI